MKKRLQVLLSDEAWVIVESVTNEANQNFDVGNVNYSDAINEMVLCSKVDIQTLRSKHTSVSRYLRSLASQEGIDFETAVKILTNLSSKTGRKASKGSLKQDEVAR